jgi:hypothetical protein
MRYLRAYFERTRKDGPDGIDLLSEDGVLSFIPVILVH